MIRMFRSMGYLALIMVAYTKHIAKTSIDQMVMALTAHPDYNSDAWEPILDACQWYYDGYTTANAQAQTLLEDLHLTLENDSEVSRDMSLLDITVRELQEPWATTVLGLPDRIIARLRRAILSKQEQLDLEATLQKKECFCIGCNQPLNDKELVTYSYQNESRGVYCVSCLTPKLIACGGCSTAKNPLTPTMLKELQKNKTCQHKPPSLGDTLVDELMRARVRRYGGALETRRATDPPLDHPNRNPGGLGRGHIDPIPMPTYINMPAPPYENDEDEDEDL